LKYDVRFQPATWSFAIWGVIFCSLGVYALGQVFPDDVVPLRNDDLLVNKLQWYYCANFLLATVWGFIFQTDSVAGYWIAEIVIMGMLGSAIYILWLS